MRLIVCPARYLAAAVGETACDGLSLISPDAPAPLWPASVGRRLVLRFNDIAEPRPGLVAPTLETARTILAFGGAAQTLAIHCHAGVSRSTAAAYMLACQAGAPGDETGLAEHLGALSPTATPNPLMIALADHILGREGRMIRAIAALGRGAETFEGLTFHWAVHSAAHRV